MNRNINITIYAFVAILIVASIANLRVIREASEQKFADTRHLARQSDDSEWYYLIERVNPATLPPIEGGPLPGSATFFGSPLRGGSEEHRMLLYFVLTSDTSPDIDVIESPDSPLPILVRVTRPTTFTSMYSATLNGFTIPVMQVRRCDVVPLGTACSPSRPLALTPCRKDARWGCYYFLRWARKE